MTKANQDDPYTKLTKLHRQKGQIIKEAAARVNPTSKATNFDRAALRYTEARIEAALEEISRLPTSPTSLPLSPKA